MENALKQQISVSNQEIFLRRLLPSATKLRRLCFYTCLSFCSQGGWYPSMHCRWYPSMSCSRGTVLSKHALQQGGACSGGCGDTPPRKQTATVADGTHHTGMHSCFESVAAIFRKYKTDVFIIITARKRSLGQGNVFTAVCHSVHSGHRSGRYASYWNAYLLYRCLLFGPGIVLSLLTLFTFTTFTSLTTRLLCHARRANLALNLHSDQLKANKHQQICNIICYPGICDYCKKQLLLCCKV